MRLLQWFRAPVFADAERTRVARLLNILLLVSGATLLLIFGLRTIMIGSEGHLVVYPIFITVFALSLVAMRRGYVYSSGVTYVVMLLSYAFLGTLGSGGLRSPTIQLMALAIIVGAVLGRTRYVLAVTALCLVTLVALATIEFTGNLPALIAPLTPVSIFFGQITSTVMIGGCAALIIASLQEARAQAVAKEHALTASLGILEKTQHELIAHRNSLEMRVAERTADLEVKNQRLAAAMAELTRAQAQLVQAEKMASLGVMVAGIAHELKNPLNFVNNFAEVSIEIIEERVGEGLAPDEVEALTDNLHRVRNHGRRADRIINEMLKHARDGASTPSEIDFNAGVREAVATAVQAAVGRVVEVVEDYDPTIDRVALPASDLSSVINNLVDNACYSVNKRVQEGDPAYRPRVEISTRRTEESIEIRVRDNGEGMDGPTQRRVFDPFFTTKPPGEGTGLGLSLTHEAVVQRLHGTIEVESAVGVGTVFVVRLRASPPQRPPQRALA